jgi:DNA-binding Lrp family transcriptional regulator
LIVITRDPNVRLREIAVQLGVTERTAQTIVNDLVDAGYLARTRVGNRSRYEVHMERPFRHPVERDHAVGELLGVLATPGNTAGAAVTHAAADSHARQADQ